MKKIIYVLCLAVMAFSVQTFAQTTDKKVSTVSDEQMKNILALHGHICAGVAIGIRVSQAALREMGVNDFKNELVGFVETDNCPVDAVQIMVGTTAGRHNLIYNKTGKSIFTFVRRADGKGIKITVKDSKPDAAFTALREKKFAGKATKEELEKFEQMMDAKIKTILAAPESDLLIIEPVAVDMAKLGRQ